MPVEFASEISEMESVTSTGVQLAFTVPMARIRLVNLSPVSVRFTLGSTAASSGDAYLGPGKEFTYNGAPTRGLGLITTSTAHTASVHLLAVGVG